LNPKEAMPASSAMLAMVGLSIAGFASGCGNDSVGRHSISGSVKVDGVPLASGNISFQPLEGQPTAGGAVVSAGKYAVPQGGGLVEGKYRVMINAPVPGSGGQVAKGELPGEPPSAPQELIPADWNVVSSHSIEVKKQGPFVFEFDVPTKAN
jgi:hypothetical protein